MSSRVQRGSCHAGPVGLLMAALILSSCTHLHRHDSFDPLAPSQCVPFPSYDVDGANVVLFPAGAGWVEGYAGLIKNDWTPSLADAQYAEPILRSCAATQLPHRAAELQLYVRQYSGFHYAGRKLLFVQLMRHQEDFPEWGCWPLIVDGGGDNFFHLEIDPERGECQNFYANGDS